MPLAKAGSGALTGGCSERSHAQAKATLTPSTSSSDGQDSEQKAQGGHGGAGL
ncbi:hypothetical protein VITFI_CDS0899 [Vitreoscilla filiformis]|uniref:Uncharacterized protein n=1 Tax=Vitreoscilla filiformis TaxID=63 RepID=A0A221KCW6_VITFI|nr:hypothetical protein VITFI_CDS0899 [Vitreoscilla filiformis]